MGRGGGLSFYTFIVFLAGTLVLSISDVHQKLHPFLKAKLSPAIQVQRISAAKKWPFQPEIPYNRGSIDKSCVEIYVLTFFTLYSSVEKLNSPV